jgi:hypothetical protein
MPAISDVTRLILWILVGAAGLGMAPFTYFLMENLVHIAHKIAKTKPVSPSPPKKSGWLWFGYIALVVFIVLGTAVASAAPNPPPKQENVSISSPVETGSLATVSIKTTPGEDCTLAYETPKGTLSTAQGLGTKTADGNGVCSWQWQIGCNTAPGTGTLTIKVGESEEIYEIEIVDDE